MRRERMRTDLRGRQEGCRGMVDAGGKRGTRMNVEAAREKLKSSRMGERAGERKEEGQRRARGERR